MIFFLVLLKTFLQPLMGSVLSLLHGASISIAPIVSILLELDSCIALYIYKYYLTSYVHSKFGWIWRSPINPNNIFGRGPTTSCHVAAPPPGQGYFQKPGIQNVDISKWQQQLIAATWQQNLIIIETSAFQENTVSLWQRWKMIGLIGHAPLILKNVRGFDCKPVWLHKPSSKYQIFELHHLGCLWPVDPLRRNENQSLSNRGRSQPQRTHPHDHLKASRNPTWKSLKTRIKWWWWWWWWWWW